MGTKRIRYYRPDYWNAPDCPGYAECDGLTHTCSVFGLVGFCMWPNPVTCDSRHAYWYPNREASLAEKWLTAGLVLAFTLALWLGPPQH